MTHSPAGPSPGMVSDLYDLADGLYFLSREYFRLVDRLEDLIADYPQYRPRLVKARLDTDHLADWACTLSNAIRSEAAMQPQTEGT